MRYTSLMRRTKNEVHLIDEEDITEVHLIEEEDKK
jgi:hypothetical protein